MTDSNSPTCRSCGHPLTLTFLDLGDMPLANSYIDPADAAEHEECYPLHARVCDSCLLVQLNHEVTPAQIFSDYAYFSSYSSSWVAHARNFAQTAATRWSLGPDSLVVEVASNDGYLLKHFAENRVPVLGIEPATNVAEVAIADGIPTEVAFFGARVAAELAARGGKADLVVANNVLAHVPDLNDFISGLTLLLHEDGVVSIEFPHLLNLIQHVQFDTIYHEHYSYFSLLAAEAALERHGLRVFDVEELSTHGGSLRLLVSHVGSSHREGVGVRAVRAREFDAGLHRTEAYVGFAAHVDTCITSVRKFLDDARDNAQMVVAYGAAAKGNTLLNACAVTSADVAFVVDRNPHKQGRLLPGSRLEIRDPSAIDGVRPHYLLILPWNLTSEIRDQMSHVREWGGRFVVPVPVTTVLS